MNKYFLLTMIALGTVLTSCNKDEIEMLNADLDTANSTIVSNVNEINRLNSEIAGFIVNLDVANGTIGELNSTVESLQVEINDAILTNEELTAVNADLQAVIDTALAQIAAIEAAAAAQAQTEADAAALIAAGQVLFAFDNGDQVFYADGTPVLLDIDGNITKDVFVSNDAWVQKMLSIYQGIVDIYTIILG